MHLLAADQWLPTTSTTCSHRRQGRGHGMHLLAADQWLPTAATASSHQHPGPENDRRNSDVSAAGRVLGPVAPAWRLCCKAESAPTASRPPAATSAMSRIMAGQHQHRLLPGHICSQQGACSMLAPTRSVTAAPRARIALKAACPGVSRNVSDFWLPGMATSKAPMCCRHRRQRQAAAGQDRSWGQRKHGHLEKSQTCCRERTAVGAQQHGSAAGSWQLLSRQGAMVGCMLPGRYSVINAVHDATSQQHAAQCIVVMPPIVHDLFDRLRYMQQHCNPGSSNTV